VMLSSIPVTPTYPEVTRFLSSGTKLLQDGVYTCQPMHRQRSSTIECPPEPTAITLSNHSVRTVHIPCEAAASACVEHRHRRTATVSLVQQHRNTTGF
jgi:hypothetical protein